MTVWIYVNTSKQVGDPDHLKVFADADAAETWFEENDPEGVAFEYPVIEPVPIAKIAKAIMRIRTFLGIGVAIPNFVYRWRQRRAVPEPQ